MLAGILVADILSFGRHATAQERSPRTETSLPGEQTAGDIELVAALRGSMPTGVTVSQDGRIFVNFPRCGDPVPYGLLR